MGPERYVMGLFEEEAQAAAAVADLHSSSFTLRRVHGPFPSHRISDALKMKKSIVGYFTLAGGILGFFSGFAIAIFTAVQWNLIVSGKPIVSLIPFFIVGFEFTILFAVFGNVIGMLLQTRLPRPKLPEPYEPKCTGTHFGVLASCKTGDMDGLSTFFQRKGGEVRVFPLSEETP